MKTIKLEGDKLRWQSISLEAILNALNGYDFVSSSIWSIEWFDGVVTPNFPYNLMEFEEMINQRKEPLHLDFESLLALSRYIKDLNDLKLTCGEHQINSDNQSATNLSIELFDSTYWEISSYDEKMLSYIEDHFSAQ